MGNPEFKALSEMAKALEYFIVSSNGVEVYEIRSRRRIRYPANLPYDEEVEAAMPGFNLTVYEGMGMKAQHRFTWVESFEATSESLRLTSDSPVLDIHNKIVPDPKAAEGRLLDLQDTRDKLDEWMDVAADDTRALLERAYS